MNFNPYISMKNNNFSNFDDITNKSINTFSNQDNLRQTSSIEEVNFNLENNKSISDGIKEGAKAGLNYALDLYDGIGATKQVVKGKITAGGWNVVEKVGDGLLWAGGKVVEGNIYVLAKGAGLVSSNAEEKLMNAKESVKNLVNEDISLNYVDGIESEIYDNTKIGENIDNNSFIKYDSNLANKVESASTKVYTTAAAIGITTATGGAAAPVLGAGFAAGTGSQAEKTYSNNLNSTLGDEVKIGVSGLGEAAHWYGVGKLGSGAISAVGALDSLKSEIGFSATTDVVKNTVKSVFSGQNIKNYVKSLATKEGMLNAVKGSLTDPMDILQNVGVAGDNLVRFMNNEEELNAKTGAKAIGEVAGTVVGNILFQRLTDNAGNLLNKNNNKYSFDRMSKKVNNVSPGENIVFVRLNEKLAEFRKNPSLNNYEELNKFFNQPEIVNGIDSMDTNIFLNFIKHSSDNDFIVCDTILNRLKSLSDDEFIEFVKTADLHDFMHKMSENVSEKQIKDFIESINNKFIDSKYWLKDHSYIFELANLFYIDNINSSNIKSIVENTVLKQMSKLNDLENSKFLEIFNNVSNIKKLKAKELDIFGELSEPTKYLNIRYKINGEEKKFVFSCFNKIDGSSSKIANFSPFTYQEGVIEALLKDELEILEVKPDRLRSALVLTENNDIKKGVNELIIKKDDVECHYLFNFNKKKYVDMNLNKKIQFSFDNNLLNAENIKSINIKNVGNFDNENSMIYRSGKYKIIYEQKSKLKTAYKYFDFLDYKKPFSLNKYIVSNDLYNITNIKMEEIDEFPSIKNYLEYSYNDFLFDRKNLYGANKYGGNQSDVKKLVDRYLFQTRYNVTNYLDDYKASILFHIIKEYFPSATDVEIRNIAKNYAESGCGYMAVANAFGDYICKNNYYDYFSDNFGYSLIATDEYDKDIFIEGIALESYLFNIKKKYGDDINLILKSENGIMLDCFEEYFTDFFNAKGFCMIMDMNEELKNVEDIKTSILNRDQPQSYYILSSSQFELKKISDLNSFKSKNYDKSLSKISNDNLESVRGGHAMLLTDVNDVDDIFVSSWSDKYEFLWDKFKSGKLHMHSIRFIGGE